PIVALAGEYQISAAAEFPMRADSVRDPVGERAVAIMAGYPINEQSVLDLRALTDVVDDERTHAILAPRVADDDDVRKSAEQLLRHQIGGCIVNGGAADRKLSALTSEENFEIEHSSMVDAGVRRF